MRCARPDCKDAAKFTPTVMCWREAASAEEAGEPVLIALRIAICGQHRLDWLDFPPDRLVMGFWELVARKGAAEGWPAGPDRTKWRVDFLPVEAGIGVFTREEN